MINLKSKVSQTAEKISQTAEHVKNTLTEAVDKAGHAATEALHEGDHALTDTARKAVGLGFETVDKLKLVGNQVAGKPPNGTPAATHKVKNPGDKIIKVAPDKTKKVTK